MAEKIDIIDSAKTTAALDKLFKELDGIETKLTSLSTLAQGLNTSLGGIKGISQLSDSANAVAESQKKANVQMTEAEKLARKRIVLEEQVALKTTEDARAVAVLSKELANSNSQHKTAIKSFSETEKAAQRAASTYLKLQAALNKLKNEYRDLAAKQAVGQTLSVKEEARLASLTTRVTMLDGALKKVDAGMGVHGRSVGNYAKTFDSLGFSVAQMTRESPAFLISMNTGFMALSNNIPIFVDEINRLTAANKVLAAEGKPTENVFKKIGMAFFSWQSLISIAILLLTIFGGKMVEFISDTINASKEVDVMAKAQDGMNKATGSSVAKFEALIAVIQSTTKSEKDRLGAMEELKSAYPDFNAAILKEGENIDLVNKAIEEYIIKLGQKAKAQAAMTLLQEKYAEQIVVEEKSRKNIAKITGEENTSLERQKEIANELSESLLTLSKNRSKGGKIALDLRDVNSELDDQAKLQDEINKLLEIYVDNVDFSIESTKKSTKAEKELKRAKVENIEAEQAGHSIMFGSIKYLEQIIAKNQMLIGLSTDQTQRIKLAKENEALEKMIKNLKGVSDVSKELAQTKWIPPAKELGDFEAAVLGVQNFRDKYGKEIDQAINITNSFFDSKIEKLQQDRDASAEYYDAQIDLQEGNEEKQDNLRAEKKIKDDELRKKQNEEAKKQAIFNKAIAIAEITIDTAVGIVKAIRNTGLPQALPFVIATGILGAAQIAAVVAQPIPKFKDGTLNAPKGFAVVGDGGKHEYIEDRFGNITQTPNVDTLVNLSGGERIHKDLDALAINKGYSTDDIYRATLLTSLASERRVSNFKLEQIFDQNLKDLDKKIVSGIQKGFANVNMHNHTTVDFNHSIYRNNTL